MKKRSKGAMKGDWGISLTGGKFPAGFTLLEVMISLAIIAGLLVTLLYTLNYHLSIAERQGIITVSTSLAKAKLYELEQNPSEGKGVFPEPYSDYSYETSVKDSSFLGMSEISVVVKSGKEDITLSELVRNSRNNNSGLQLGTGYIPSNNSGIPWQNNVKSPE